MKNNKVSPLAIYLLCLAVVLALYYALIFTGLSQKTSELNEKHSANLQQISFYSQMIQKKPTLQNSIAALTAKKENLQKLPGLPAAELGTDLNKGLESAGVSADSVTLSDETTASGKKFPSGHIMKQVTVSLTLDCTEKQLIDLLDYYEKKSSAVYYVNSLSTNMQNQTGQTASSGKLAVLLNMTAYSYSSSKSATGAAS